MNDVSNAPADAYYGEDDASDEIDLSFLDEDETAKK